MSIGDQILQEKFEGQNVIPDAWWLFIFLRPRMNAPGIDSQWNVLFFKLLETRIDGNRNGLEVVRKR